jgi:hypothetical protein
MLLVATKTGGIKRIMIAAVTSPRTVVTAGIHDNLHKQTKNFQMHEVEAGAGLFIGSQWLFILG